MTLLRIHHVNISIPKGKEAECTQFYEQLLGLTKAVRPDPEISVPGVWYDVGPQNQLHIVYSDNFRGEQSGDHFAVEVVDMKGLLQRLRAGEVEVRGPNHMQYDNSERYFCRDPFGNQIEFMSYNK